MFKYSLLQVERSEHELIVHGATARNHLQTGFWPETGKVLKGPDEETLS